MKQFTCQTSEICKQIYEKENFMFLSNLFFQVFAIWIAKEVWGLEFGMRKVWNKIFQFFRTRIKLLP
ncbi:hypothetical protein RHGRI_022969 [Rhododendron griersonianum]|uniref:Uncharacterized protein n=1 Tax=Rhododendron griersonianum TaxID=479676 RepID=A0AAV6J699_9ERIC|nr:hypothetical protein RHGRI_022969 [Rhododendron griersonianum]